MAEKSPEAYRTIGEASKEIGVPSYVLRFWETKFRQIKLIKRPGGRRFYRPEDILLLLKIKNFLKKDGLSIKEANNKLNNIEKLDPVNSPVSAEKAGNLKSSIVNTNNRNELLKKLEEILKTLS
jgi:DNA-binding transcriptional MerR regulator